MTGRQHLKGQSPPAQQAAELIEVIEQQFEQFSGPIPHPEILRAYGEVVPDGPERIFRMAEAQAEHRQGLERVVVHGQDKRANRGQIFGFVLALVGFLIGGWLVQGGHDWAGVSVMGADLASIVGLFVYGRHTQRRELTAKRRSQKK